jgi:hypothetical protein
MCGAGFTMDKMGDAISGQNEIVLLSDITKTRKSKKGIFSLHFLT